MHTSPFVCTHCRTVNKPCCTRPKRHMSSKWRAPKKSDDKAWRKIERGEIFWDEKALAKKMPIWNLQRWTGIPAGFKERNRDAPNPNRKPGSSLPFYYKFRNQHGYRERSLD